MNSVKRAWHTVFTKSYDVEKDVRRLRQQAAERMAVYELAKHPGWNHLERCIEIEIRGLNARILALGEYPRINAEEIQKLTLWRGALAMLLTLADKKIAAAPDTMAELQKKLSQLDNETADERGPETDSPQ